MKQHYGGNTVFYQKASISKLTLKDIFSDAFKKHSRQDGEKLFAAGTSATTPSESAMLQEWKKPWLFVRVLSIGILILALLYFMIRNQGYFYIAIAPFAILSSAIIPLSILIFYWEMNIPRNIPIYTILLITVIGGVLSLIITSFLDSAFNITPDTPAYYVAFIEEPAKLAMICLFLPRIKKRYILNGILIGGAVGAGFAAMETSGYFIANNNDLSVMVLRAFCAPGGHVLWAAIYGGALAAVMGSEKLQAKHFMDLNFLKYFASAVALHFIWDTDFSIFAIPLFGDVKLLLLIIVGWLILLSVLNKGVQQILAVTNSVRVQNPSSGLSYVLVGISGLYKDQAIPLNKGRLVIGRDPSACNLIYPPDAGGISRQQCTVTFDGKDVWLFDSNSSNGTFLGSGERMQGGVMTPIRAGQRFYLASPDNTFELRCREE